MTLDTDTFAIILSLVALALTAFGVYASFHFYTRGTNLQKATENTLNIIQMQVNKIFDRTLDAAIGQKQNLNVSFEDLERQLETAKDTLLNEVLNEIDEAGDQQQHRLKTTVENQMKLLHKKMEVARESAVEIADESLRLQRISQAEQDILNVLSNTDQALSHEEVRQQLKASKSPAASDPDLHSYLQALKNQGLIECPETSDGAIKYRS